MDKKRLSFLKDGDTLREAAALFIRSVSGTKTNNRSLVCYFYLKGENWLNTLDVRDYCPFPKSITNKFGTSMSMNKHGKSLEAFFGLGLQGPFYFRLYFKHNNVDLLAATQNSFIMVLLQKQDYSCSKECDHNNMTL